MEIHDDWIVPDWPAPASVQAWVTTRNGGVSEGGYASFNLGAHVGDDPRHVARNRYLLRNLLPHEPLWLNQVHGCVVADADIQAVGVQDADAILSRAKGRVCTVMTADCLPVLFCDKAGSVVAAAHAGWRGLAAGALEEAVRAMRVPAGDILAWLGPAIGPAAFEVGEEVRAVFVGHDARSAAAFMPKGNKWLADIYRLARLRLDGAGVKSVYGGGFCTYTDSARFYSYRRDGQTGRMAALVWLK